MAQTETKEASASLKTKVKTGPKAKARGHVKTPTATPENLSLCAAPSCRGAPPWGRGLCTSAPSSPPTSHSEEPQDNSTDVPCASVRAGRLPGSCHFGDQLNCKGLCPAKTRNPTLPPRTPVLDSLDFVVKIIRFSPSCWGKRGSHCFSSRHITLLLSLSLSLNSARVHSPTWTPLRSFYSRFSINSQTSCCWTCFSYSDLKWEQAHGQVFIVWLCLYTWS